jgi:transcriptional regulator with XRE-family HTH domain
MTETFGQRLRRLRDAAGLTIIDLATVVGCAEGTIRQIENGHVKSPSMILGVKIADALHADVRFLALGDNAVPVGERLAALEAQVKTMDARLKAVERRR